MSSLSDIRKELRNQIAELCKKKEDAKNNIIIKTQINGMIAGLGIALHEIETEIFETETDVFEKDPE